MHILDRIVAEKKKELTRLKAEVPVAYLKERNSYQRSCVSLTASLKENPPGVIAEYKRRSPSEAEINSKDPIKLVVPAYEAAGAIGLSVLTDGPFFGGSLQDLEEARSLTGLPILRKDFMLDPYQLFEAKAYGADVILLIAAILEPGTIRSLADLAHELGMEVLLEVHDAMELKPDLMDSIDILGVNNRNLKTFEVSIKTSIDLAGMIPKESKTVLVSESGLKDPHSVRALSRHGFQGFLVGTHFMKQEDPGKTAAQFIKSIRHEN